MQRRVLPLCWLALNLLAPGTSVRADENLDAEFLRIHSLIQEGESLEQGGQAVASVDRFGKARRDLEAFAKAHPGWNRKIIQYRLEYLGAKLGAGRGPADAPGVSVAAQPGSTTGAELGRAPATLPAASPADAPPGASAPPDLVSARERAELAESRLAAAEAAQRGALARATEAATQADQVRDHAAQLALDLRLAREALEAARLTQAELERTRERLEHERGTLEARLKEALSPRPASLDPAELAKAEERILLLVKENEILEAGLEWQATENRRVLEKAGKALELEQQLAATRAELSQQRRQTDDLRSERQKLQSKYDQLARKSDEQTDALRADLESLRKELASARGSGRAGSAETSRDLATLRAELSQHKTAAEKLRRENQEMAEELGKLTAIRVTPASLKVAEVPTVEPGSDAARVRRLERERDELRRDLETARADLRRSESGTGRSRELTRNVERLSAKVAALEARSEPYTQQELALFQAPSPESGRTRPAMELAQATATPTPSPTAPGRSDTPAAGAEPGARGPAASSTPASGATNAPVSRRRTTKDLPPGASILAAQAERAFRTRRLDEAEKAYRDILKLDESNVFTLANLAAILVELGRLEEAETYLKRALAGDPQDAFSLSLFGILRFRQQKFDEAFEALSQSAAIDPENSDTQNYLGITLSQRGQRPAAEAALRKAIKLNPASASAHYNLSVVYATQKPPFLELARYHYEKARRSGQPANPAFEGLLRGEPAAPKSSEAAPAKP